MTPGSVTEALELAARSPVGITFVNRTANGPTHSFADLWSAAGRAATSIARRTSAGEPVGVLGSTSPELVAAVFGIWRAGRVPALLSLPRRPADLPDYPRELFERVGRAGARLVVVADELLPYLSGNGDAGATIALGDLFAGGGGTVAPAVQPAELALLQFTSGTLETSRVVPVTQHMLLSNLGAAIEATGGQPGREVVVIWLPLFHDMGLGMLLCSVLARSNLVLQSTEEFLARPGSWLDAVDRFGGTFTASPNFGYGLAARDLAAKPRSLDLSSLRCAANGGEPIDPDTLDAFADAGRPHGLRRGALVPMYGLAEATVAVSIAAVGDGPRWVDGEARHALDAGSLFGTAARPLVACGRPVAGMRVAIRAPAGEPVSDGAVGEICVHGSGVFGGYLDDPAETESVLRDGWLQTGDLGFIDGGDLVVCGRLKDVIIVGGTNVYAEDYEHCAERVPGVRRGNAVAFAVPSSEEMIVLVEGAVPPEGAGDVAQRVSDAIAARLAAVPHEVAVVAPGSLAKTSSGKKRRQRCRALYEAGQLETWAVLARRRRARVRAR
jgi:fatty-acyl-CoA synthase